MNQNSQRYQQWFPVQEPEVVEQSAPEPAPRPRYLVWVAGSKATIGEDGRDAHFNGEMLSMAADLIFVEDEDEPSNFNIAVQSPEEGMALIRRIANCMALGLIELEDDGIYHEWYDDEGNSSTDILTREGN